MVPLNETKMVRVKGHFHADKREFRFLVDLKKHPFPDWLLFPSKICNDPVAPVVKDLYERAKDHIVPETGILIYCKISHNRVQRLQLDLVDELGKSYFVSTWTRANGFSTRFLPVAEPIRH